MVEVYNYDISTHERFARDQRDVEDFQKQYQIKPSGAQAIAVQTKILDFVPKHAATVLLMQTHQRKLWARFTIPDNYHTQRLTSSYIAPSLGSIEKQNADIKRMETYLKTQIGRDFRKKGRDKKQGKEKEEMVEEGELLIVMLEKGVKQTNEMIDFIFSRMHQFIQA